MGKVLSCASQSRQTPLPKLIKGAGGILAALEQLGERVLNMARRRADKGLVAAAGNEGDCC